MSATPWYEGVAGPVEENEGDDYFIDFLFEGTRFFDPLTTWGEIESTDVGDYPPGTEFVMIGGVVIAVDEFGEPAVPMAGAAWTEMSQGATTMTHMSQSATSWTEKEG